MIDNLRNGPFSKVTDLQCFIDLSTDKVPPSSRIISVIGDRTKGTMEGHGKRDETYNFLDYETNIWCTLPALTE